jgi:hypothetical protein
MLWLTWKGVVAVKAKASSIVGIGTEILVLNADLLELGVNNFWNFIRILETFNERRSTI